MNGAAAPPPPRWRSSKVSVDAGGGVAATAFDVWPKKTMDAISLSVKPHETKLLRVKC